MNRRKWGVNAHTDEFQRTATGEYVYTGSYYAYQDRGKRRLRAMGELVAVWAVAFAATVAAGCIPGTGMENRAYAVLPYAIQLVASVSLGWGVIRLAAGGDPLRAYVYDETAGRIPRRAIVSAVGCALTALGELLGLLFAGEDETFLAVISFFGLEILAFFGFLLTNRVLSGLHWEKADGI
ncbi:MAG: hypothetical protein LUC30_02540 [Clostridiales bacterium]|nr:hypothetical protein [Clostridiales bacterium]